MALWQMNDPHAMIRGSRPANCLAGCVNPAAGLHHHICPNRRARLADLPPVQRPRAASAQRGDGGAGRAATLSAWARAPSSPPLENGDPWPHHEDLDKLDALDEDRDYQPETLEQVYARAAVVARAHFRWLEREKQEPELRKERTSIFEDKKYARCNFVDKHECIIDALREMGGCLCRRPGDASCEMCLADKTGASSGQSWYVWWAECELGGTIGGASLEQISFI